MAGRGHAAPVYNRGDVRASDSEDLVARRQRLRVERRGQAAGALREGGGAGPARRGADAPGHHHRVLAGRDHHRGDVLIAGDAGVAGAGAVAGVGAGRLGRARGNGERGRHAGAGAVAQLDGRGGDAGALLRQVGAVAGGRRGDAERQRAGRLDVEGDRADRRELAGLDLDVADELGAIEGAAAGDRHPEMVRDRGPACRWCRCRWRSSTAPPRRTPRRPGRRGPRNRRRADRGAGLRRAGVAQRPGQRDLAGRGGVDRRARVGQPDVIAASRDQRGQHERSSQPHGGQDTRSPRGPRPARRATSAPRAALTPAPSACGRSGRAASPGAGRTARCRSRGSPGCGTTSPAPGAG